MTHLKFNDSSSSTCVGHQILRKVAVSFDFLQHLTQVKDQPFTEFDVFYLQLFIEKSCEFIVPQCDVSFN